MVFMFFFCLMIRRPPRSKRTDTFFPYPTLCRSGQEPLALLVGAVVDDGGAGHHHTDAARRSDGTDGGPGRADLLGLVARESLAEPALGPVRVHPAALGQALPPLTERQLPVPAPPDPRSDARPAGTEWFRTCRYRCPPYH